MTSGSDFWHTKGIDRVGVPAIIVAEARTGSQAAPPRTPTTSASGFGAGDMLPAPRRRSARRGTPTCCIASARRSAARRGPARSPCCSAPASTSSARRCAARLRVPLGGPVRRGRPRHRDRRGHPGGPGRRYLAEHLRGQQRGDRPHARLRRRRRRACTDATARRCEAIVAKAHRRPSCAVDKVNSTYASEHHSLLTEVCATVGLRGARSSRTGAPCVTGFPRWPPGSTCRCPPRPAARDEEIVAAVRAGALDEAVLDQAAARAPARWSAAAPRRARGLRRRQHHRARRRRGCHGARALRAPGRRGTPSLAERRLPRRRRVAWTPRATGRRLVAGRPDAARVHARRARGHALQPASRSRQARQRRRGLLDAAVAAAATPRPSWRPRPARPRRSRRAPDRPRLGLPDNQPALLEAVAAAHARVVVVLANGSRVCSVPWHGHAATILETWLGGQAAAARSPTCSAPPQPVGQAHRDDPAPLAAPQRSASFPGEFGHVRFGEGVLVGFRWYDAREPTSPPFGTGCRCTRFDYSDARDNVTGSGADASVDVRSRSPSSGSVAGSRGGAGVRRRPGGRGLRPVRELKGFAKVTLEPGASKVVTLALRSRAFACWHPGLHRWLVRAGRSSSRSAPPRPRPPGSVEDRGRGRADVGPARGDLHRRRNGSRTPSAAPCCAPRSSCRTR